jgi:hypothetical protein
VRHEVAYRQQRSAIEGVMLADHALLVLAAPGEVLKELIGP